MNDALIWLGILVCITQSALFSGSNIAVFSLSLLRLEAAAAAGDRNASRALALRRDANFTLVTILVGNVAINVLLTLLSDSVMAGLLAFLFSTVAITAIGEIIPQAYFSRNALKAVSLVSPALKFYSILLWPIAKPVARLLDIWVGSEAIPWFRERELGDILRYHAERSESEVGPVEATGAINFLALDDLSVQNEGEPLDPESVITLPVRDGRPVLPAFSRSPDDAFLRRLEASGKKWVVAIDPEGEPRFVVNAHLFLRDALFSGRNFVGESYFHRPAIVRDPRQTLDSALVQLVVRSEDPSEYVINEDIVLVWTQESRRIITGSDVLGCLLRGIARKPALREEKSNAMP